MKYGISVSIDVTAIDKAKLVKHKNGKVYLNMTTFVDPENEDQYGQHGFITQETSKEEREAGFQSPILGNCKVFWSDNTSNAQRSEQYNKGTEQAKAAMATDFEAHDIPF